MRKLLQLVLIGISVCGWAQDYAVSEISESLLKDANAVVRKDEGFFKILSIDKAEFRHTYAMTILNERANDFAYLVMGYDKLSSLSDIEVNVFDKDGKRIRKVKSNEINDRSAYTGNLFDDARIKYVDVSQNDFPYTVEFSHIKKYKFLYTIPDWSFGGREHVSVQSSRFSLEYPLEIGARYKENNFDGEKTESEMDGNRTIIWKMDNIPVTEPEEYGPEYNEVIPNLNLSVAKFSFEGYEGDMSTWDGIAAWQRKLNEGRNDLSEKAVADVVALTQGMSREEKIRAVYKYVQENTRYVSIQLGVGGFQPFPASVVEENGYGDCKALSFYTQSLLEAVGLEAYYTWTYGGSNPPKVDPNFPQDSFNHIILAVPNENDTIWLECTSQTNPFGYLGKFTGDREVLLINESGGHVVRTTSYPLDINNKVLTQKVQIDSEGHALINSKTYYQGIMADRMLSRSVWSYDDQKKYLEESIDIPTFEIQNFKIERVNEKEVESKVNLWVNKLLSKSGTRLFLQPNMMNKNTFVPLKYQERKTDIVVRYGYHEYDSVNFEIPSGFRIEAQFDPVKIDSEFGVYTSEIVATEDGKFQYIRHFMQKNGRFDAAKYEDYLEFHKQVVRADKRKIALVSGT